jgi:DNA repair protein RecO (recombination protein O)
MPSNGQAIHPDRHYLFELERGPVEVTSPAPSGGLFRGRELIALREGQLSDADTLQAARRLLSRVLNGYLGEQPLKSRSVLKDIYTRGLVE